MTISLVSVVIPVRNGLPFLDTQLHALADQDYSADFEVVVSDNGSTDGTRAHVDRMSFPFPLRCVDSSQVRGVSHARNVGIAAARGEFLAITDHDDAVHSGWLTALVREAENYDALGGSIEVDSLNSVEVASWRSVPRPEDRFESIYLPWAHGNNFAFWRRVVDTVGYFDEDLVGGGDDVDYSWRIQQAGMTLGHVPDAVVAYRVRPTLRASFAQGFNYGSTACRVTRKHSAHGCPNPSPYLQIPAHAATIAYLATIRNPWLPKPLNPPPRGLWAHAVGLHYGAMTERLKFIDPRTRHREPPTAAATP